MEWPILYGIPSNGKKIKQWHICVKPDEEYFKIVRTYGYIDCKMTISEKRIESGKNIGKKNETSVYAQACAEAQSLFTKQKEKMYTETMPVVNEPSENILPMLAHDFNKRGKDIVFPCYVQPKIDGVRLLMIKRKGKIELFSRTGKIMNIPHLCEKYKNIKENIWYDGELFTFKLPFEEITGLFRTQKNINEEKMKLLEFMMFDCYDPANTTLTFSERLKLLPNCIDTRKCDSREQIDTIHAEYIAQNYEGIMLRNSHGVYKPQYRSKDLQKLKEFQDEEFIITGSHEGKGDDKGTIIFECKSNIGEEIFSVRPRGSVEYRTMLWKSRNSHVGKQLTVRFQNLTENKVPRFPVGISIRDFE